MKTKLFTNGLVLLLVLFSFSCKNNSQKKAEQEDEAVDYLKESQEDFDQRMNWWREARFGMFIHWGVYAVPAGVHNGEKINGIGEWIQKHGAIPIEEYEKYARQFNPTESN